MTTRVEIEVEIDRDGKTKFHIKGEKGKNCLKYVELFEKILGKVTEKSFTSEYYEQDVHISTEIKTER